MKFAKDKSKVLIIIVALSVVTIFFLMGEYLVATGLSLVALAVLLVLEKKAALSYFNKIQSCLAFDKKDKLTGLWNAQMLKVQLESILQDYRNNSFRQALMIIDIDNFDVLKDRLGKAFGDAVFLQLSEKLLGQFRSYDVVGRLGEGEFFVIMKNITKNEIASIKAHNICDIFRNSYLHDQEKIVISASMGIAVSPEHGTNADELIKNARTALLATHDTGKDGYTLSSINEYRQWDSLFESGYVDIKPSLVKSFSDSPAEYIFSVLFNAPNSEKPLQAVLQLIAEQFSFSRGYVFEVNRDNDTCSNTFEWCAPGISSQIDSLQNVSLKDEAIIDILNAFKKDDRYIVPDVDKIENELEKELFLKQNVKSLIIVATFKSEYISHFIGFDDCINKRDFASEEVEQIITSLNIVGVFLARLRSYQKTQLIHQKTKKSNEMLRSVFNNMSHMTYIMNLNTYEIIFENSANSDFTGKSNIGCKCYEALRGESKPCEVCPVRDLTGSGSKSVEFFNKKFNIYIKAVGNLIEWNGDAPAALINVFDISEYKQLINAIPLGIGVWTRGFKRMIMSNKASADLFDLCNENEYLDKFFQLSPAYQPNGEKSKKAAYKMISYAFEHGYARFDWLHRKLNGEKIPCEITLVRTILSSGEVVIGFTRDKREQLVHEQQLAKKASELQSVLDASPLAINVWDKNMKFVWCNQAAMRLAGVESRKDVAALYILQNKLDDGAMFERLKELSEKTIQTGRTISRWEQINTKNEHLPLEITMICIKWDGHDCFLTYARDMREQIKNEQHLVDMNSRIKSVIDLAPISVIVWDENLNIIMTNQVALQLRGATNVQYFKERFFSELMPEYQPDGRKTIETVNELFAAAKEQGRVVSQLVEFDADKKLLPLEITIVMAPSLGKNDNHFYLTYARDLREQLKNENLIRVANESMSTIIDSAPFVITLWRKKSIFGNFWHEKYENFMCNKATVALYGLHDEQEYLQHSTVDLFPEYQSDGRLSTEIALEVLDTAWKSGFCTLRFVRQDFEKHLYPLEMTLVRIPYGDDTVIVEFSRDLRAQLQAETEKYANEMKGKFLANMSHEIRTPINAIMGMTELALRHSVAPEIENWLLSIRKSSESLSVIINDILDFSKIESGKLDIICNNYSIISLALDLSSLAEVRIHSKSVVYELYIDPNMPVNLYGDEVRIKQIIANLITNAAKFTHSGKIKMTVTGDWDKKSGQMKLTFVVEDTGIGIRQEDMERLFDSFLQLDQKQNHKIEGTGLGLAIVKRLCELMDGQIRVESTYGVGSRFIVDIPQKVIDDKLVGNYEYQKNTLINDLFEIPFAAPRAKVLVVDDNGVNLEVAQGLLKQFGIESVTANSAKVAFELIENQEFDLIFMDHMMPEMDGVQATKILRESGNTSLIVALTANAIVGAKDIYLNAGFDDYMTKPIDIKALSDMLLSKLPPQYIKDVTGDNKIEYKNELPVGVLKAIFNESKTKLPLLKNLFETGDIGRYAIEVHALKSVAALAREFALSDLAKKHEFSAKAQDVETINQSFTELLAMYEQFVQKVGAQLEERMPKAQDIEKVVRSSEQIQKYFDNISYAVAEFDLDEVMQNVNILRQTVLSDEQNELVEQISEASESFDYDGVAALLNQKNN